MDHRTADDYSSFFSVLGGSILTSRSLLYGTGFQEYTGDQSAPAYADECELFLPVTEKVSVEKTTDTGSTILPNIITRTRIRGFTIFRIYTPQRRHLPRAFLP